MSEEYRQIQIIDPDLFSGSIDAFRTAHGGYYQIITVDDGTDIEFSALNETGWETTTSTTTTTAGQSMTVSETLWIDPDAASPYIDARAGSIQFENAVPIDTRVLTPNKKMPMRIYGDPDAVKNDLHWKTILIGGNFGETSYTALYNDTVHSYFNVPYDLPYTITGSLVLSDGGASQVTMQMSYKYNNYLPLYQAYASNVNSELLLPNIDIIYDLTLNSRNFEDSETRTLYEEKFINFVTVEGNYKECSDLLGYNPDKLPRRPFNTAPELWIRSEYPDVYKNNTHLSIEYLTSSYIQTPLSASTQIWAKSKLKNILYDTNAMEQRAGGEYQNYTLRAPYGMYFETPHYAGNLNGAGNWFLDSIKSHNFDSRFIKSLYEVFGDSDIPIKHRDKEYIRYASYLDGTLDTPSTLKNTAINTMYREVDYMKFLSHCYNNYNSPSKESFFIGARNLNRAAADDTTGIYRHVNTEMSIGAISDAVKFMSGTYIPFTSVSHIFGEQASYTEVLAYRIEKIGGPPTGDSKTQNVLQNFWMIKNDSSDKFNFTDTQVKYDQEYTYNVYAYVIAGGYRYRYTDLAVSRDLDCTDDDGKYGLELYDPYAAGEPRTSQIFSASSNLSDFNEDAGNAQILSDYKYVADVYLNYEPTLKIIEVPLISKTLKIQDNPINNINVIPYQIMDTSQRIGFQMSFGTFLSQEFPVTLSAAGDDYGKSYKHARDYISNSKVLFESVSRPRYIQIYRLSERPTTIRDFDGALIKTLDLAIENNTQYSYNDVHFDDTIKTNQKYYYIMRALNQQRNVGLLSEIYEAQLINDGGYLYAMFNVLYHYEIEQEVFINPTKSFKKIFQLQPNMSQIELNTENIDYNKSAVDQIENLTIGGVEDSIWDKQFKIRLTSKKTGRKIDLNITYNLNSD